MRENYKGIPNMGNIYGLPQKKAKRATQYFIRSKNKAHYIKFGAYGVIILLDSPLGAFQTNKQYGKKCIREEINPEFEVSEGSFELVKVSNIPKVLYK